MPTRTVIRVFVSGPSDTERERDQVRQVLRTIGSDPSTDTYLVPVSFEDSVISEMGPDPQAVVNAQIGDNWEIYIGILKQRFGTPTPRAASGTLEEFEGAIKRWKKDKSSCQVMLFFHEGSIDTSSLSTGDIEHFLEVRKFRDSASELGIYQAFQDLTDFQDKVTRALLRVLRSFGSTWGDSTAIHPVDTAVTIDEEFAAGILDLQVDIEEASQSLFGSLGRFTTAMSEMNRAISLRTFELDQVQNRADATPAHKRGVLKATGDDLDAFTVVANHEVPIIQESWATTSRAIRDLLDLVWPEAIDEKQRASGLELLGSLGELRLDTTRAMEGLHTLEATQASLLRISRTLSRDLSRAIYASRNATLSTLDRFGAIDEDTSELIRELRTRLDS